VNCAICGTRKPKRHCPGLNADICSICCGTEREQSVDCPIGCDYLREAHRHEKPPALDPSTLPNQDIRVPESFLQEHEWLLVLIGSSIADGAQITPGTTDYDIREGMETLIRTYRGLESGLIVEDRPSNLFASNIFGAVQERISDLRKRIAEADATSKLEDSTILAILVFLQRLEYSNNNGRKRSRAFFDFLMQFHVPAPGLSQGMEGESIEAESLEPEAPRVIL
jgi:hypothetical protein